MDGTPTLRLNEFMLASLAANKIELGPARTETTGADLEGPRELKFELDGRCREYIDAACEHFDALVARHEMQVGCGFAWVRSMLTCGRCCTMKGMEKS